MKTKRKTLKKGDKFMYKILNKKIPDDVIVIGATKGNSVLAKCIKFFQCNK